MKHKILYYRLEEPIVKILYLVKERPSRVRYNSAESEPIWMKSGIL